MRCDGWSCQFSSKLKEAGASAAEALLFVPSGAERRWSRVIKPYSRQALVEVAQLIVPCDLRSPSHSPRKQVYLEATHNTIGTSWVMMEEVFRTGGIS